NNAIILLKIETNSRFNSATKLKKLIETLNEVNNSTKLFKSPVEFNALPNTPKKGSNKPTTTPMMII
ncbi:MAG: hypothetical protein PHS54_04465, partial [Clostridia bacterium]|nr:hypothetical protein [Clostridia bacterium]